MVESLNDKKRNLLMASVAAKSPRFLHKKLNIFILQYFFAPIYVTEFNLTGPKIDFNVYLEAAI